MSRSIEQQLQSARRRLGTVQARLETFRDGEPADQRQLHWAEQELREAVHFLDAVLQYPVDRIA